METTHRRTPDLGEVKLQTLGISEIKTTSDLKVEKYFFENNLVCLKFRILCNQFKND